MRFEGTGHPERTRPNNPPAVASRPLKKKQTRLAATPTPVHHDPDRYDVTICCTSTGSLLVLGLIHLFMLVEYYDDEWSKAYCEETGLASWMLGIASTGLGSFPHQLLIAVSRCCISRAVAEENGDYFSGWPFCWVLHQIVIVLLQIYWFCRGQSARPRVDLARPPTHPHTRMYTHTRPAVRLILRTHSPRRRHGLGNRQLRQHHVRRHHKRRMAGLCDRERWTRHVRP